MPYQNLDDGLYLLVQKSSRKGVDHYGILDVGNRLKLDVAGISCQPVVVHQTPPSLKLEWLQETGSWNIIDKILDEKAAIARIREAAKNPNYNLFNNNCEHFANYVATGVRQSKQLQAAVVFTGLSALTLYLISKE